MSVEDGLLSIRRGFRADELRAAFARAGLPAVTSGQVGAYLGSPLVTASGHVVGVLARPAGRQEGARAGGEGQEDGR